MTDRPEHWREPTNPRDPNNPYRIGQTNDKGQTICGAKCRDGHKCGTTIINPDNGRCRKHRGGAAKGLAHYGLKTGRYSRYLSGQLVDMYHAARDNMAHQLEQDEELSLLEMRLGILLQRIESGEAGQLWAEARKLIPRLERAWSRRDEMAMDETLSRLRDVFERGQADHVAWKEAREVIQERRVLGESERKRLIEARSQIKVDEALTLVGTLLTSLRAHIDTLIHDPELRTALLVAVSKDVEVVLDGHDE